MNFTEMYVQYCKEQTDAPPIFHTWLSYFIVSCVVNKKCYMPFGYKRLHPNLYILIVAPSSAHRKSWSMSIARHLINTVYPGFSIPDISSREAFVSELAGNERVPGGCGMIQIDELKGFMDRIRNKSYMEGFAQDLSTAYDGTTIDRRKGIDNPQRYQVENPFVNIMAGCSTDWLYQSIQSGDISGGFFARFIWVVYDKKIDNPSPLPNRDNKEMFSALIGKLERIKEYVSEVSFSEEAKAYYSAWYKKFYSEHQGGMWDGNYHRASIVIQKIACLNAIIRTEEMLGDSGTANKIIMSENDIKKSIVMVEDTFFNFRKITIGVNKYDTVSKKILKFINNKKAANRGDILRGVRGVSPKFLTEILNTLEESMAIKVSKNGKEIIIEPTENTESYLEN